MVVHPSAADSPPGSVLQAPAVAAWQRIDWRRHQRWVRVGERALNTIEAGEGDPAIVFVHGLSGCWPNWLEQLGVFSHSHRVLAFDLPGFGHSPGHAGEVSMPGYARIVADLLSARGIERAVLVGNSMGGLIGAELAAEQPSLVERLVLVSPAGISTYANRVATRSMPAIRRGQQALALAAAWTASHSDSLTARRRMRSAVLAGVVAHPGRLPHALAAEQLRGAGTDGFLSALEAILEFDLRPRLPLISSPTLVVWGKKDRLISWHDAARFTEAIPDAREVVYEDTGHMAMLERPREFNELLAGFLSA